MEDLRRVAREAAVLWLALNWNRCLEVTPEGLRAKVTDEELAKMIAEEFEEPHRYS